jgi:predicted transcriptional regulator
MLTQGEDVEAHALHERGWTISAIARHLDRDRKTVRSYLDGTRTAGVRARSDPDRLRKTTWDPLVSNPETA